MMIEIEERKQAAEEKGPEASPFVASRTSFFRPWPMKRGQRLKAAPVRCNTMLEVSKQGGVPACEAACASRESRLSTETELSP